IMAGNRGGKKKTTKKSGKSTTAHVAEEHGMKSLKRKRSSTGGGVSSRTRARKAISNGNEPVREESNPVRGTTVVSLSVDTESEGMSAVSSKVINSVLIPTVDEETFLARIIDPEQEYHREGSTSDRWNYWLNVKQEKIWWKELYDLQRHKENVTIVEGSSSNSGLESMLKGVEERIVKAMEEGFSGINLTVETKLEAMNWTMGELEKNQRVLNKKAKKIEDRLTSIESKGNEDEEYRQWNDFDYGKDHGKDREMVEAEKDKEKAETGKKNSEEGEEDEENSGKDEEDEENSEKSEKDEENNEKSEEEEEQEPEKTKKTMTVDKGEENVEESNEEDSLLRLRESVRVQAEEFWRTIDDESDDEKEAEIEADEKGEKEAEKDGEKEAEKEAEKEIQQDKEAEKEESKGTRTSTGVVIITPRGRTKVAAARKVNSTPPEIVVKEQEAIQTEIVEKEADRKPSLKVIAASYGIPRAERLAKMRAEAEKKENDGVPKKRGKPKKTDVTLKPCTPLLEKRKGEPSRWVQSPFSEGKTDELEVPKKKFKTKT
ncbi:LOW QUALITY PROTEIN: hypothetical protein HID58_062111, partial [Brassica napus]